MQLQWPIKFKKEKPAVKVGLSTEEYLEIAETCMGWLKQEEVFHGSKTEKMQSAYYNIASFNLCRIGTKDIDVVFQITAEDRSLSRLIQLYLNLVFKLGKPKVDLISKDIQESLIELDVKRVRDTFKRHPYLVLIPTLNVILTRLESQPT
jgi:hypothetical protein